jgi:hypothetical protein
MNAVIRTPDRAMNATHINMDELVSELLLLEGEGDGLGETVIATIELGWA